MFLLCTVGFWYFTAIFFSVKTFTVVVNNRQLSQHLVRFFFFFDCGTLRKTESKKTKNKHFLIFFFTDFSKAKWIIVHTDFENFFFVDGF